VADQRFFLNRFLRKADSKEMEEAEDEIQEELPLNPHST
jgi:hypothetical protein